MKRFALTGFALAMLSASTVAKDLSDMVDMKQQQKAANTYIDHCYSYRKPRVTIGMSDYEARCTWGEPDKVNRTTNRYGVQEQWVYRSKDAYLYFDNGRLTSIQD